MIYVMKMETWAWGQGMELFLVKKDALTINKTIILETRSRCRGSELRYDFRPLRTCDW